MSRNMERPKIGSLSDEPFSFKEIAWKISHGEIFPNTVNYELTSPSFSFASSTWTLLLSPFGHTQLRSHGWIDLGIERLDSNVPEHHVFCKFYFLTHRGKEFEPYQDSFTFNANCKVNWMMYAEKIDFLRKERTVIKDGFLTIVCQMRTPKINGVEEFSQTEITDSVGKSSASKSTQESSESTNKGCDSKSGQRIPHPNNKTLQDFKQLFLNQEGCDVIIRVGEQEFHAHRNIIGARSPVFASTFKYDTKEKLTGVVDISDCDPSFFADFLCFLYCGDTENITTGNVFSLFIVSDKYDVQDLRSECLKFLKENLSVDTFCETVTLAFQYFEKELIELTSTFFAENLQKIIVTVKWQSFVSEFPAQSNEIMIKALVLNKK